MDLVKKASNHRAIFEWLDLAFQTVWEKSKSFRRLRGMAIQVKGRYNISNDRSQRWNIRFGAVSLSSLNVLMDYRQKTYPTKGGCSGLKVWFC
jgi:ribosomal protein S3